MNVLLDTGPLDTGFGVVQNDAIDLNGHMNVAYYALMVDKATDVAFEHIGVGFVDIPRTGNTMFIANKHLRFHREVGLGDTLRFTTQILGYDDKRLHMYHRMIEAKSGALACSVEMLSLHASLATRRVTPFPPDSLARLAAWWAREKALPVPEDAGKPLAVKPGWSR